MMRGAVVMNGVELRQGGFLRRHRPAVIAGGLVLLVLGVGAYFLMGGEKQAPRKVTEFTMVKIMPPPPPPPPQEQPVPKMIEQPKMVMPEDKPAPVPPQPKTSAPPTGPLGLDAKGEGPGDAFNLAGNAGGNGLLSGGGGSRWGWYASIVQDQVGQVLRSNSETRRATFDADVEIWADASGRVTRVRLKSSTHDAALDRAIENQVFAGMVLREPPPSDMPMPMVLHSNARQPG